jgi:gamma-glutamyltranspeptidase/glutathione hydrolase
LQNRGANFVVAEGHPNRVGPAKRPYHTIIPGFMQKGGRHIGFGIMGGMNQPLAHAQFVSNFVDYRMNIQEALSTARFTVSRHLGCNIVIESRVPAGVRDQLTQMGHILDVRRAYSTAMGRGQAVLTDTSGTVHYGASDPRADGSAEPEPPPLR